MAIRPFQFTFSRDRLVLLLRTTPTFSFSIWGSRLAPSSASSSSLIVAFRHRSTSSTVNPRSGPHQLHTPPSTHNNRLRPPSPYDTLAQKIGKSTRRPGASSKARVYTDINVARPKDYWDYESLLVQWG